jgi:hypothetical protein
MVRGSGKIAQAAIWVTASGSAFDETDFGYCSFQNGWNPGVVDDSRLYLGADENGTNSGEGIIDNLKVYNFIKTDWTDQTTEVAPVKSQVLLSFTDNFKKIGQIRICCCDFDSKDYYPRSVQVDVRRSAIESGDVTPIGIDATYWETVYTRQSNNESDFNITLNPYPLIDAIRVYSTGDADYHWRVYQISANEYNDADVAQWAKNKLSDLKDPEAKATLTLVDVDELPDARGQARVTNRNGTTFTYDIASVTYSQSGDTVSIQLGELPLKTEEMIRELNRTIIENQYTAANDAANISSGDGMQENSIGPSEIDYLIADSITTGRMKSRNYGPTSGMMMNLDEALFYIREADGLKITSLGGVEILSTGGQGGHIRGGQTAYDTGTGFWLGVDGSTPKFSIGNSAGNKLTWNGTALSVSGAISGSTIDIGGADATSFHVDGNGNMWLGAATFNIVTNPFAVSNAGVLRVVSGTVGGWTLGTDTLTGGATTLTASTGAIVCASLTANTAGQIGGFTIGATTLANGTDLVLDASNKKICLSSTTFGNKGVQIEYNGGKPRMYLGDGSGSFFKFEWVSLRNPTYKWTASGSGTNEYYVELSGGGDPSLDAPAGIFADDLPFDKGTIGSLAVSEWAYGDNDTLGYITVYVRLADGADPDSKAVDFVQMNNCMMSAGTYAINDIDVLSTRGKENIFVGEDVAPVLSSGYSMTMIGYAAGHSLIYGSDNIAMGRKALYTAENVVGSIAIGNTALYNLETGADNIAIGHDAGRGLTTGHNNCLVGGGAGYRVTTGSHNVAIGSSAGPKAAGSSRCICAGYLAGYYETGSDVLLIDNRDRDNEADSRAEALIYGIMADTTVAQELHFNCKTYMLEEAQFGGGYGSTGCTIEADGDIYTDGIIHIGTADTAAGELKIFGDGTGSDQGGKITLQLAADHDGTFNSFIIQVFEDDLYFGLSSDTNAMKLTAAGNLNITAGAVDSYGGYKDNGSAGVDGWFDDGANFRVTVSGGIITAIANSSSGGHS